MKEILFTCVIYATTVYQCKQREVLGFVCPKSCCDMIRTIPPWFQVLNQLVLNLFSVWGRLYNNSFVQNYVSCTFTLLLLEISDIQFKFICTFDCIS